MADKKGAQRRRPAQSLSGVKRRAEQLATEQGLILIDAALVKEPTGTVLRFTIDNDAPEGVSLDDCEKYHRALIKLVDDDLDYDYMEVTSPGADRPLNTERDFTRALGQMVEVRFYRQIDGVKQLTGRLAAFDERTVTIEQGGAQRELARQDIALIRLTLEEGELDSPLFERLESESDGAQQSAEEDL